MAILSTLLTSGTAAAQCLDYYTLPHVVGSRDGLGEPRALAQEGSRLYLARGSSLTVVDAADAASMPVLGSFAVSGQAEDVAVRWPYAYVTVRTSDPWFPRGLRVVDITTPSAMQGVDWLAVASAGAIVVEGPYA